MFRENIIIYIFVAILLLPYKTSPHFIWPLSWCLLADICNHTWIPECGEEKYEWYRRLFTDECDLYEYNCDFQKDFLIVNYSDCFVTQLCPTQPPCPSVPTCPAHNFHRMGQPFPWGLYLRMRTSVSTRPPTTIPNLPSHMLRGYRRYRRENWIKQRDRESNMLTRNMLPSTIQMKSVLTTKKWVKRLVSRKKVVRRLRNNKKEVINADSDFLE